MAQVPNSSTRGVVIQGRFLDGRPRIPVVALPPSPVQPRMAGWSPIPPGVPPSRVAQRQAVPPTPLQPYAAPVLVHPQRKDQPNVAQPKVFLSRSGQSQRGVGILPANAGQRRPDASATGGVVQRVGNGEAFQLPASLSNFGGGGGQPLPAPVRQKMESFFNASFADVRVHVGAQASSIGALAFTQGSNLYFAPGQYNPGTAQGQQLLGHELTHVMQQRAGRVRNPFGAGIAVVQDRAMEAEADRMGLRAAAQKNPVQASLVNTTGSATLNKAVLSVRPFIQMKTAIKYDVSLMLDPNDKIRWMEHARISHAGTNPKLAAQLSGYKDVENAPGDCKHYVAYDMIVTAIHNKIVGMKVKAAVKWLNSLQLCSAMTWQLPNDKFNKPFYTHIPLGKMPSVNIQPTMDDEYDAEDIDTEVDDLIHNLANDPRNLYYWKSSKGDNSGTSIDTPKGNGPIALKTLNVRLTEYHKFLKKLGLDV